MFLDTNFNSLKTVLSTLYHNFVESAMKYYRYAKGMAAVTTHASLFIGTFVLIRPNVRFREAPSCAAS